MFLDAHLWTVWPLLRDHLRPEPALAGAPFVVELDDLVVGTARLGGVLRRPRGRRQLVVLVHGLGGCAESRYLRRAARVADERGLASLRLNLRGADRRGGDLYHAGLSSDLAAVLESPALDFADEIYILGYSLGGHVTLRFATETGDPRLAAVAAVCSPLDLKRTVDAFDRPRNWLYRRHVLGALCEIYREVDRRAAVPLAAPPEKVCTARTLREFDRLVVVPRFGFASTEEYYSREAVGPRLGDLRVPALLVAAEHDPMVAAEGIRPALEEAPDRLETRWVRRGGHVGFPDDLDLGQSSPYGLEEQVLTWLRDAA